MGAFHFYVGLPEGTHIFEAFEASANRQAQKRRPFFFCDGHFILGQFVLVSRLKGMDFWSLQKLEVGGSNPEFQVTAGSLGSNPPEVIR